MVYICISILLDMSGKNLCNRKRLILKMFKTLIYNNLKNIFFFFFFWIFFSNERVSFFSSHHQKCRFKVFLNPTLKANRL